MVTKSIIEWYYSIKETVISLYNFIIIDDEISIHEHLLQAFDWSNMGYCHLQSFSDAESTLEWLKDTHRINVDLIIADIRLGEMNGLELAEEVKKFMPEVHFVFISAYREFEYAKNAIQIGSFDYIIKPVTYSAVTNTFLKLRELLDREHSEKVILKQQLFTDILLDSDLSSITQGILSPSLISQHSGNEIYRLVELDFINLEDYLKSQLKYEKESFQVATAHILKEIRGAFFMVPISNLKNGLYAVAISKNLNAQISDFEKYFDSIRRDFSEIFHVECHIYGRSTITDDLYKLREQYVYTNTQSNLSTSHIKLVDTIILHINNGEFDQCEQLVNLLFNENNNMLDNLEVLRIAALNLISRLPELNDCIPDITAASTIIRLKEILQNNIRSLERVYTNNSYILCLIDMALQYIDQHFSEDISLNDVASCVALSPTYFSRYFKQQTGERFMDYLCKVRMEKALVMITDPTLKVYEIANAVGYKSLKHFYKLFRNHTGYTPTKYRNTILHMSTGDIDEE